MIKRFISWFRCKNGWPKPDKPFPPFDWEGYKRHLARQREKDNAKTRTQR